MDTVIGYADQGKTHLQTTVEQLNALDEENEGVLSQAELRELCLESNRDGSPRPNNTRR